MSRLRWRLRLCVLATLSIAVAALGFGAALPAGSSATTADLPLFALLTAMAALAQVAPVHLSVKLKMTVEDTATFAAALLLPPFLAMVAAGLSTMLALHFRGTRMGWYNRAFNASASLLSTGAAAAVFLALAGPSAPVLTQPWPIVAAGATKYLVHSGLVDLVVALQLRRNPVAGWWGLHRRLLPYESALLLLGALAAITAERQPWAILLFGVPMAVTLLTVRDSARVRAQTRAAILELADLIDLRDPYPTGTRSASPISRSVSRAT